MQALDNVNQQAFVLAWLNLGSRRGKQTEAALLAGYCPGEPRSAAVTASRLMRTPTVIAAIQEETKKRLASSVAMAADFVENVLDSNAPNVSMKDKLHAANMLMDRGGMAIVQKVEHTHVLEDRRQRDEDRDTLLEFAKANNLDPKALLGNSDLRVIDGEFTEVANGEMTGAEGLEDLLG